mmetsp:Transcript_37186/g.119317  ORF Transcript_37186/g.119317 Transcript_37186/m.119317 type:complete len:224 (-) Transcript_37186:223-894(-)
MQSTGQVAMASAMISSVSPSCRTALARPCSSFIVKVCGATQAQFVHPMHVASSTKTMRSRSVTGSPSSSTVTSSWLFFSPKRSSSSIPTSRYSSGDVPRAATRSLSSWRSSVCSWSHSSSASCTAWSLSKNASAFKVSSGDGSNARTGEDGGFDAASMYKRGSPAPSKSRSSTTTVSSDGDPTSSSLEKKTESSDATPPSSSFPTNAAAGSSRVVATRFVISS